MSKIDLKEVDEIIENDFRYLISWGGEEFTANDKKTLENLKKKNRNRLKKHLEKSNGIMGDFQYE